jgi:electron transfer flavoprotein alpha subunit
MAVLVIADVNGDSLAIDPIARTITAVSRLGEVHILLVGDVGDDASAQAARLDGVSKVLVAADRA